MIINNLYIHLALATEKEKEPKSSVLDIISRTISFKGCGAIAGIFALIQMLSGIQLIENQKSLWSFSYTPIIGGILLGCSMGSALYLTGQILGNLTLS